MYEDAIRESTSWQLQRFAGNLDSRQTKNQAEEGVTAHRPRSTRLTVYWLGFNAVGPCLLFLPVLFFFLSELDPPRRGLQNEMDLLSC